MCSLNYIKSTQVNVLHAGPNIFLSMDFAVVKNCGINQLPQLVRVHLLQVKLFELSCRTYVNGVVNLGDTFVEVLYFDVNQVLPFLYIHNSVEAPVVTLHEFSIVVFVLEKVGLKVSRNALLSYDLAFYTPRIWLDLSQEIFDIRPSVSIVSFHEFRSLTAFFVLNIQVEIPIFQSSQLIHIRNVLLGVIHDVRVLVNAVGIV